MNMYKYWYTKVLAVGCYIIDAVSLTLLYRGGTKCLRVGKPYHLTNLKKIMSLHSFLLSIYIFQIKFKTKHMFLKCLDNFLWFIVRCKVWLLLSEFQPLIRIWGFLQIFARFHLASDFFLYDIFVCFFTCNLNVHI